MRRWPVITMGVAALAVGGLGATLERGAAAPTIAIGAGRGVEAPGQVPPRPPTAQEARIAVRAWEEEIARLKVETEKAQATLARWRLLAGEAEPVPRTRSSKGSP